MTTDNTLSAMPGDAVLFKDEMNHERWETVRSAGWQPTPNGGKVWSYEIATGETVPYTSITAVKKLERPMKESPPVNPKSDYREDVDDFVAAVHKSVNESSFQPQSISEKEAQDHQDFLTIDMRDLNFLLAAAIRCVAASREEKSSFRELKYLRTASKLLELRIKDLNDKAPIKAY